MPKIRYANTFFVVIFVRKNKKLVKEIKCFFILTRNRGICQHIKKNVQIINETTYTKH